MPARKSKPRALTVSSSSPSPSPSPAPLAAALTAASRTALRQRSTSLGFSDDGSTDLPPKGGGMSWTSLGVVCSALALCSLLLHLFLDVAAPTLSSSTSGAWEGLGSLALAALILAVPLTHGLVGVRKHGYLSYQFWQPFVGGLRFVLLQVLAWTIYSFCLIGGVYGLWVGGRRITAGWLSAVGVGGVVSQLLVLVSLHFFVSNVSGEQGAKVAALKAERARLHRQKVREARRQRQDALKSKIKGRRIAEEEEVEEVAPAVSERTSLLKEAALTSLWPWGSFAMKVTFFVLATCSLLLAVFVESGFPGTSEHTRVSLQSLLTSAILLAVPATHLLARKSLTHAGYLLFQPFKGGKRFVALQALAWSLWTIAFVSAGASFVLVAWKSEGTKIVEPSEATSSVLSIPWHLLSGLITSAGVGGILSQAVILLSLRYFDARLSRSIETTARVIEKVRREGDGGATVDARGTPTPSPKGSRSATPLLESEVLERAVAVLSSPMMAHSRLSIGVPSSFSPHRRSSSSSSSLALPTPLPSPSTPASVRLKETVEEGESELPPLLYLPSYRAAVEPTAAEEDELTADGDESPDAEITASPEPESASTLARVRLADLKDSMRLLAHRWHSLDWKSLVRERLLDAQSMAIICVLYGIPIVGALGTFVPVALLVLLHPWPWYAYTAYAICAVLYASTYRNRPSLTGARSWPAFRNNTMLWEAMNRYFSGQVIALGSLSQEKGPYIFGFHPHGIYPLTTFWATRGPQFRSAFPGVEVDVCGASIMFHAPLIREICMWAGGREVSGTAIRWALKEKRSIMLVPGGQREMRHSVPDPKCLTLVTRHRGFIRMALEFGTPLVPVLSLGECMLLENIRAPRMQAYTLRTVGVGFPIWPYGRGYSPLPNAHPVVVIFGAPISVPLNKEPSIELIEEIHTVYYQQIQSMFLAHRHMVPGMHDAKLVFTEE